MDRAVALCIRQIFDGVVVEKGRRIAQQLAGYMEYFGFACVGKRLPSQHKSANELLDATMELSKLDSEITLRSKDSELLKHELDELTMGLESQTTLILSLNSDKDEISMNQRTTQKKLEETIKQLASYK